MTATEPLAAATTGESTTAESTTVATTTGEWIRPATQGRSRATVARIMAAATDVFTERGYEGLSIAEVCRMAGVSAGALYARFDSKDALVRAVHDAIMTRLSTQLTASFAPGPAWAGLSPGEALEHAVRLLVGHFRDNATIIGTVARRGSHADPIIGSRAAVAMREAGEAFVERVLDHAVLFPHPDPRAAAWTCFAVVYQTLAWDVSFGAELRVTGALPADDLGARLPEFVRLYLFSRPGDGAAADPLQDESSRRST